MSQREPWDWRAFALLAVLTLILIGVLWRFWPALMTVETGKGLPH